MNWSGRSEMKPTSGIRSGCLGKPINTEVHKIMKKTKNKYHHKYKKCQKAEDKIRKNKLINSCLNGEGQHFVETD